MSISKPALDLSPALLFHPGEDWSERWEIKVNWFKSANINMGEESGMQKLVVVVCLGMNIK